MNFLLIVLCLFAGWSFRHANVLGDDAYKSINAWILYVSLPAVALHYIPSITWNSGVLLPLAMPLIVFAGAWILITIIARRFALDAGTRGALILTAGLGNTSFIGFPLTQAYLGEEGLRIAVMCDQMTFVTLSTFGVVTAMHATHNTNVAPFVLLKRIVLFPPFLGFVAAVVLPQFVDISPLDPLFEKLSVTLVPLALFSVGLQIRFSGWKNDTRLLTYGLAYKLFVAPLLILLVALIAGLEGIAAQTSVFEASMPPMITAAILASEYRLNPQLANTIVSLGILLSLLTSLFWWVVVNKVL
ncbi:MAG: AEC family transporter [Bacteroidota bacterium]